MNRAMSGMGNAMSNLLEESRAISAERREKVAKVIETEDGAAFKALEEEYSEQNILTIRIAYGVKIKSFEGAKMLRTRPSPDAP
jgi:hypothetical protein